MFSTFGIFLFAIPDAIAFSLEEGDIGVVGESVEEGCDTSGVGEDGVPVLEGEIGGEDDGASVLVALVDDVVEEVGGVLVVGEVSELVDGEELWPKVLSKSTSSELGRVAVEIVE